MFKQLYGIKGAEILDLWIHLRQILKTKLKSLLASGQTIYALGNTLKPQEEALEHCWKFLAHWHLLYCEASWSLAGASWIYHWDMLQLQLLIATLQNIIWCFYKVMELIDLALSDIFLIDFKYFIRTHIYKTSFYFKTSGFQVVWSLVPCECD